MQCLQCLHAEWNNSLQKILGFCDRRRFGLQGVPKWKALVLLCVPNDVYAGIFVLLHHWQCDTLCSVAEHHSANDRHSHWWATVQMSNVYCLQWATSEASNQQHGPWALQALHKLRSWQPRVDKELAVHWIKSSASGLPCTNRAKLPQALLLNTARATVQSLCEQNYH